MHATLNLRRFPVYACALAALGFQTQSAPADTFWQAATNDWSTSANWSAGTPDSSANAFINNAGTAQINFGNAAASFLTLGQAATDSGSLSLSGGTLTLSTSENIGNAGNGTFTQAGGTHLVNGTSTSALVLGAGANSHGTYFLSGTGILNASNEYIGEFGTGTFIQTGGTNTTTNVYMASANPSATGFYTLANGSLTTANLYIGYTGRSHFTQLGGNLSVTTNLAIINPSSSLSIANASDSAVSASDGGDLAITGPTATTSAGSLNVTGGYTQSSSASLDLGIGGTIPSIDFATLSASSAALNGTLNVTLTNGFVPSFQETFKIISYTSRTGAFSSLNLPTYPGGHFNFAYTSTGLVLTAIPEPASLAIAFPMAILLARKWRRPNAKH